jgi:hypothetical protein
MEICPNCLKVITELVSTKSADVYSDFGNHMHVDRKYSTEIVYNK